MISGLHLKVNYNACIIFICELNFYNSWKSKLICRNNLILTKMMKALKITWIFRFTIIVVIGLLSSLNLKAQPGANVSNDDFYNELEPYGKWIDDSQDGYVWQPDVERGFRPYATNGHWAMTEYGNTWVSNYSWGWAPFHYGRWRNDSRYGWVWLPGQEWGPAWVSWRAGNGYYGWAPLGPDDDIYSDANIPVSSWVFVPETYIVRMNIYNYYEPQIRLRSLYSNSVFLNNYFRYNNRAYVCGPRQIDIERQTRSRIVVYRINNLPRPGQTRYRNGYLDIYRPNGSRGMTSRRYNSRVSGSNYDQRSRDTRNDDNKSNRDSNRDHWEDTSGGNKSRNDNQNDRNRGQQDHYNNPQRTEQNDDHQKDTNPKNNNGNGNQGSRPDRSGVRNPGQQIITEETRQNQSEKLPQQNRTNASDYQRPSRNAINQAPAPSERLEGNERKVVEKEKRQDQSTQNARNNNRPSRTGSN